MKHIGNFYFILLLFFLVHLSHSYKKRPFKKTSKPSEDYHVELISSDSDVEQKKNSELLSFFSSSEEKQRNAGTIEKTVKENINVLKELEPAKKTSKPSRLSSRLKGSISSKTDDFTQDVVQNQETSAKTLNENPEFSEENSKNSIEDKENDEAFTPRKVENLKILAEKSSRNTNSGSIETKNKLNPLQMNEFPLDEEEKQQLQSKKIDVLVSSQHFNEENNKTPEFSSSDEKLDEILNKHKPFAGKERKTEKSKAVLSEIHEEKQKTQEKFQETSEEILRNTAENRSEEEIYEDFQGENSESSLENEEKTREKEDFFKPKLIKLEEKAAPKKKIRFTETKNEQTNSIMKDLLDFEANARSKALENEEKNNSSTPINTQITENNEENPEKIAEDAIKPEELLEKEVVSMNSSVKTQEKSYIPTHSEEEILDFFKKQREKRTTADNKTALVTSEFLEISEQTFENSSKTPENSTNLLENSTNLVQLHSFLEDSEENDIFYVNPLKKQGFTDKTLDFQEETLFEEMFSQPKAKKTLSSNENENELEEMSSFEEETPSFVTTSSKNSEKIKSFEPLIVQNSLTDSSSTVAKKISKESKESNEIFSGSLFDDDESSSEEKAQENEEKTEEISQLLPGNEENGDSVENLKQDQKEEAQDLKENQQEAMEKLKEEHEENQEDLEEKQAKEDEQLRKEQEEEAERQNQEQEEKAEELRKQLEEEAEKLKKKQEEEAEALRKQQEEELRKKQLEEEAEAKRKSEEEAEAKRKLEEEKALQEKEEQELKEKEEKLKEEQEEQLRKLQKAKEEEEEKKRLEEEKTKEAEKQRKEAEEQEERERLEKERIKFEEEERKKQEEKLKQEEIEREKEKEKLKQQKEKENEEEQQKFFDNCDENNTTTANNEETSGKHENIVCIDPETGETFNCTSLENGSENNQTITIEPSNEIKEQISDKVQNRVKQLITEYGIDCKTNTSYAVNSLCSICDAQVVYALNGDNWFKLGLAYNQRKIYSELLDVITTVLPSSNFYIAFSDQAICLSSDHIYGNVTLSDLVEEFTGKNLNEWELSGSIFVLDEYVRGNYFQIKLNIEHEGKYYSDFQFSYRTVSQYQMNLDTYLTANNVKFFGNTDEITIEGYLTVNKTFQTAFILNYTTYTRNPEWITINLIDHEDKYSISTFLGSFFGDVPSSQLIRNLDICRGIKNLEKLHAKYIDLKIMNSQNSTNNHPLSLIDLTINYIPNFSISPEFSLYNCQGNYMIFSDQEKNKYSWKLVLNCECRGMEEFAKAYIIKDAENEKIFINSTRKNLSVEVIKDKIFKKGFEGKNLLGLFPDEDVEAGFKLNFEKAIFETFSTEVLFSPQQIYRVSGRVYLKDMDLRGSLSVTIANLGGKLISFATFNFTQIKFHKFLSRLVNERVQSRLFELSKIINPEKVIIITCNEDIDFKDFNVVDIKSINGESYWNKGVHLLYEFSLDQQNCGQELFCKYMNKVYGNNASFSLIGDVVNKNEYIRFQGKLPDAVLASPFKFRDVTLNLPLSFQSEEMINFEINGKYALIVENNKTISFEGSLLFAYDDIIFKGNSADKWMMAFDLDSMSLNQIYMKGTLDLNSYIVETFSMTGLVLIGDDCFTQSEDFLNNKCFYGNADVKIDYDDPSQNYLQGYFSNITIYNLLTNTLDFGTWNIYENVTKHILLMKFIEGAEISYANEDITEKEGQNQSLTILQGYTVKAEVNFIGLNGIVIINIDPFENELYGIFHFTTTSFAAGNVMVFETNYSESNNMMFKVNSGLALENQIYFNGHVGVFGVKEFVNISINNIEFRFNLNGTIFNSEYEFALDIYAPFAENIFDAVFTVTGHFPQDFLTLLESSLMEKSSEWIEYIKNILEGFEQKTKDLETLLNNKKNELCDEELCPKSMECADEPREKCVKFKEKFLCKKEDSYCLKPDQTCAQETKVCVSQQEICLLQSSEIDENGKFICLEKKTECVDFVIVCSEWKHICSSESVTICLDYEDYIDENVCEESQFVCKITEVRDKNCVHECQTRLQIVENYEEIFYGILRAKENLDAKLMGFWTLYDEIKRDPKTFIDVISGRFEEKMDKIIEPTEIVMEIGISSFSGIEDSDVVDWIQIIDFDFKNIEKFIDSVFEKLTNKWSWRFNFDPVILKENESNLMEELYGHLKNKNPILTEIFSNKYQVDY